MDDHLASVAQRLPENAVTKLEDVECQADVKIHMLYMSSKSWFDSETPGRPYLHMQGVCNALHGDLPYGLKELKLKESEGIPVDVFYEFTDDELSELVGKGLYNKGFKCPDSIKTDALKIPVYCNFNVVLPVNETDLPVVFADIADRRVVDISHETTGYRFADYFETLHPELATEYDYDFEIGDLDESLDLFAHEDKPEFTPEPEVKEPLSEDELRLQEQYHGIHKRVVEEHVNVPLEAEAISKEEKSLESELLVDDIKVDAKSEDIVQDTADDEFDEIFAEEDDSAVVDETKDNDEKVVNQRERRRVAIEDIQDAVDEEIHNNRKVSPTLEDVAEADNQVEKDNEYGA